MIDINKDLNNVSSAEGPVIQDKTSEAKPSEEAEAQTSEAKPSEEAEESCREQDAKTSGEVKSGMWIDREANVSVVPAGGVEVSSAERRTMWDSAERGAEESETSSAERRGKSTDKSTLEKGASVKNGVGRVLLSGVFIIAQVVFLFVIFFRFTSYAPWVSLATRVLALALSIGIYSGYKTSSIKMPWIILILVLPIVGVGMYLIVGLNGSTNWMERRYKKVDDQLLPMLVQGEYGASTEEAFAELKREDPQLANVSAYIIRSSHYPLYKNTDIEYFDDAAAGLAAQKEELRKAEHFIFMEYHAIEDKESWHGIQDILEERARAGVEVRVFYDDIGSMGFINVDFVKRLESKGIQCRVFNPVLPFFNLFLNNRDHRKITVIDGKVGFTGGYNLANEYFNITHPYGRWKDTGIKITGDAVRSLTATFLENWNAVKDGDKDDHSFIKYLPKVKYTAVEPDALVQPYADSPLDNEHVGEDVYISMANKATEYCWFITPYLILTDEMIHALGLAAKRGVDVRVITPGIPDKKTVYQVTRSYYNTLTRNGVRIYEWKPGFCHCKMCVADDKAATCGTINLDFRSLYHHFENGCLYMHCKAVMDTRHDFERIMSQSEEVTEKYSVGRGRFLRFGQLLLRLFAPLL